MLTGGVNYVNYIGKKYGIEKESVFYDSDLFVFPTYNETFGLVIVEAMAHGLPVIATDEGAISDIIIDGETGLIVEKRSPYKLAEKMKILLDDPQTAKLIGAKAQVHYKENFTLGKFEKRICDILADCCLKR